MQSYAEIIAKNLLRVRACIARAANRVRRDPDGITIVAVSKTHPAGAIRAAFDAGIRHFGENRVQEWEAKRGLLHDVTATWHLIGHLQSNKTARAVELFDVVDSVDSIPQIQQLERFVKDGRRLPILLEVRMDAANAKTGFAKDNVPPAVEAAFAAPKIELRGLMCIPPFFDVPDQARVYFRGLRELRDSLVLRYDRPLPVLSMGMSHDFEIAIEEGATEIRLGTALFGPREPLKVDSEP
ncbi:MAG TPA: YggS family pyridoxal phosphate-dependent enzyme [Candidatus Acidoferrales bacterium]|nr:YggS family pyridoxal phosphate-dependent enzyme [Candidatus Acidoferrales bacterium]